MDSLLYISSNLFIGKQEYHNNYTVILVIFQVIFCTFVQSDIFDKSKVLLKPTVLVVFYSPINCRRQYHCEVISLEKQIPLAVWRIKLPSVLKNTRHKSAEFFILLFYNYNFFYHIVIHSYKYS